ncbi:MAG TPA: DUF445 family protein, partial [Magnetospirillaceae bacterium]|nr:DUF445 family protein [Magnetospirillaceae bacterium]
EDPLASRPPGHPLAPSGMAEFARRIVRALAERRAAGSPGLGSSEAGILGAATLGGLLDSLGPEAREDILDAAGAWLAGFFAPGAGGSAAGAFASAFALRLLEGLSGRTLGEAAGWDGEFRDRLAIFLAEHGTRIAAREVRRILEGVDLHRIVTDKVNALDMLEIERILLRLMARQLRGITVLGGVLGALIGGLQLAVEILRR